VKIHIFEGKALAAFLKELWVKSILKGKHLHDEKKKTTYAVHHFFIACP